MAVLKFTNVAPGTPDTFDHVAHHTRIARQAVDEARKLADTGKIDRAYERLNYAAARFQWAGDAPHADRCRRAAATLARINAAAVVAAVKVADTTALTVAR